MLVTLEEKVRCSELVAVGTVTGVELKTIRTRPGSSMRAQDTIIRFRVDECILGEKKGEILIEAHSVSFREGNTLHDATAGFSNHRVTKGKRFIGYLKKVDDRFILSGESNQFLEDIDDLTKTIRDVGQTSYRVPLEWKMNELRKLVLQADWTKKAQPAGAGQPATKPADKPPVKDQPSTPTSKDAPR
jgi:hypothetical protein